MSKPCLVQTEVGENDGRGGRELSTGSIVELIGMGAGFPMPSDVKVDTENIRVIMVSRPGAVSEMLQSLAALEQPRFAG